MRQSKGFIVGFILGTVIMAVAGVIQININLKKHKQEKNKNPITFPAEDIRCVQQDGKIVFCESYREEWR
jgi:hypothetical protein